MNFGPCDEHTERLHGAFKGVASTLIVLTFVLTLNEDRGGELWIRLLRFPLAPAVSGPSPWHQELVQAGWKDLVHFQLELCTF